MTTRITGTDPATGEALAVTIEAGRIAAVERGAPTGEPFLAPALIDLQVNGFAGHDLNPGDAAPRPEVVAALVEAKAQVGVTRFCPTLITASAGILAAGLAAIAAAREDPAVAAAIPFAHLEGPWISPAEGARGAHPLAHVRDPDIAEFEAWDAIAPGLAGMVTLCPARPGAPGLVRTLAARGVRVAIGHTDAAPEVVRAAAAAGASLSTHLGNGIPAMLPRHPNAIWAQLAEDRLAATFIADGHHLPADTLLAMLRAKGEGRAILVSDATAFGGRPPGRYRAAIGGEVELSADGRLSMAGTPYLAGAARPLKDGVAHVASLLGLPAALAMAGAAPGRVVGAGGRMVPGERADLIRFRWQPGDATLHLLDVLRAGAPA